MTYPTVTLCGSMSYYQQMLLVASRLTCEGYIVLMPHVIKGRDGNAEDLDKMHLSKIDRSSLIIIVSDETGYYGDSTKKEIEYAMQHNIEVNYCNVVQSQGKWI